ncbi:hypothetical protein [Streptomyces mirabilis]|uniref:hypothetical protein n=1 Tax=Streptomyces mirabilis TaxID=68239 RepID=UPI0036DD6111
MLAPPASVVEAPWSLFRQYWPASWQLPELETIEQVPVSLLPLVSVAAPARPR